MPKHDEKDVVLPEAAREHISETAKGQLAEHAPHVITTTVAEPQPDQGVYRNDGAFGPGWYHYSTPGDDVWLGHEGESDYYVFDFDIQFDGSLTPQGNDRTNTFESGGVDNILLVNEDGGLVRYVSASD